MPTSALHAAIAAADLQFNVDANEMKTEPEIRAHVCLCVCMCVCVSVSVHVVMRSAPLPQQLRHSPD